MVKQKAVINMTSDSVWTQIEKSERVQDALEQPLYNGVTPVPAEVRAIIDLLRPAQKECDKRNYEVVPVRNDLVQQLQKAVRDQCNSVNAIAKGDPNYLAYCGFGLSKIPTPRHLPEQGVIKKIVDKDNGTVLIILKALLNCAFYKLAIEGPDGLKLTLTSTVAKFKVADLPKGVVLKARVCGINNKGEGTWSPWVEFDLSLTTKLGGKNQND